MSRIHENIQKLRAQRQVQANPEPTLPQTQHEDYVELGQHVAPTVTVFDGTAAVAPQLRLCMLAIGLVIVLLLAISIILIVTNQHKSHSLKPGHLNGQGNVFAQNAFAVVDNVLEKHSLALVSYEFRLSSKIQEWTTFPIPGLVLENQKIQGFHVCCLHEDTWQCDNPLAFLTKLQQTSETIQLLFFTEAALLAGDTCVLEIKLLS